RDRAQLHGPGACARERGRGDALSGRGGQIHHEGRGDRPETGDLRVQPAGVRSQDHQHGNDETQVRVGVRPATEEPSHFSSIEEGRHNMPNWSLPLSEGHMEKPTKIYFQTMTKFDVDERLKKNDILLVPIGSTENHGQAGPYGEDTFIVTRIAEMVAQATGCTVAEPMWYGSHPFHHIGQPGTVPLPDNVFTDHIRAMISGFWNTGFRKQIFLSMHGQEYALPS